MGSTLRSYFIDRRQIPESLIVHEAEITGLTDSHVEGFQPSVDTTERTLWEQVLSYNYLTAAATLQLSSSSTDDDVAGTGALTVEVKGLDTNYLEVIETVILTGRVAVNMITDLIRVNSVKVITAGSGGKNAGDIYVSTGALTLGVPDVLTTVYAKILIGINSTLMGIYSAPANKTAYIIGGAFSANADCDVRIVCRPFGEVFFTIDKRTIGKNGGVYSLDYSSSGRRLAAKGDVELRAISATGTASVTGNLILLIVDG